MSEPKQRPTRRSGTIPLKPGYKFPYWSRLDAYIFSEINYPFWLAMMVYNGIFFIKILGDISEFGSGTYNIPFKLFVVLFLTRVPDILFLTAAISFISGSLFAMRRMSTDSEIIAPQSLGISFWRMNRAVFAYGGLLALFMFVLNNWGGPALMRLGNDSYNEFLSNVAIPNINEGVNPLGSNAVLYVDNVEEGMLARLLIINRKGAEEEISMARRASIYTSREVELVDWIMCSMDTTEKRGPACYYGDNLVRQIPIPKDLQGKSFRADPEYMKDTRQLYAEMMSTAKRDPVTEYELYRRLFTPALFLILAMFAVPLAARHSRLHSGNGIALSLFCIGVYFMLSKMGKDMAEEGRFSALAGAGIPLLLFFTVGLILQVGKNLWWSQYWRKSQGNVSYFFSSILKKVMTFARNMLRRLLKRHQPREGRANTRTFVFPSKLDFYTIRSFFSIYLIVQASFLMLFVLVEYLQLSDSIRKHQIGGDIVAAFFLNKMPDVIDLTMFISLLIAILLLFTFMSKNQEIVAIRAGGGSMQRLCLPLLLCGVIISGGAYYLENSILPNTNRSAQNYRNTIRKKNDTMFSRDVWMRTGQDDLLNYKWYDWHNNRLMGVTHYHIDGDGEQIGVLERTYWPVLSFDGGWRVTSEGKGWRFTFAGLEVVGAEPIHQKNGKVIELDIDTEDLRQRKRKASEFSIPQLKEYVKYLSNMGYEEGHYQTELYAKYAKPLIPFFMMLLAMPLGIQMGRRGTFYGVAIGFAAGLSFLGLFELSKEFGASGYLNPIVAGWTVVVVFGFFALNRFINLE